MQMLYIKVKLNECILWTILTWGRTI